MFTENQMELNDYLSFDELVSKKEKMQRIVVKAVRLDYDSKFVECEISNSLKGIIPINEFTPELKEMKSADSNIVYYPQIAKKIGKKLLVYITDISDESSPIYLSRKESIIEAYEYLKTQDVIECEIDAITDMALYLDCGYGVGGRVYVSEAVSTFVNSLRTCEFEKGEIVKAKILNFNDEHYNIDLSLLQCCEVKYSVGDIVTAKIRKTLDNNDFSLEDERDYFVEILPSHFSGILNAKVSDNLKYDDTVTCIITHVKPGNKHKLKLIEKDISS